MTPAPSLDAMRARTIEVGECWEWQGCISSSHSPRVHYEGRARSARKLMLALASQPSEPPPGHKLVTTCGNPRCVRPEHLAIIGFAEHVRTRLVPGTNMALKNAKIAHARRQRGTKLTAADVCELRRPDSSETAAQAAARLGVSVGHVNAIRRWRVWREHTASPWAGMGARQP